MADAWQLLRDHVAAHLVEVTADRIDIAMPAGGTTVPIAVSRIAVLGEPWIELRVPLREAAQVPSEPALERNFALAIGGLGIADGMLVLRHLVPLAALDTAVLDRVLAAVVAVAVEAGGLDR